MNLDAITRAELVNSGNELPPGVDLRGRVIYYVGPVDAVHDETIRKACVVAFEEIGMEAIYEFEVKDMPVTVAVNARGESVHESGPREWGQRIKALKIPVRVA